jgi:predicted MPP superfamily phosphohydrolase
MKKILSIGDVHGYDSWKKLGDIRQLITYSGFLPDFDHYVFVGDYTDSFEKTNVEIFENLVEIIKFKTEYPDNVVLLLGNHDIQYMYNFNQYGCSGFRPEMYFDLNELFNKHRLLFQVAFQVENYLWTHAGVSRGWYNIRFPYKSKNVADDLNLAFLENNQTLHDIGRLRGGYKDVGGPFWADKRETWDKPIKGYHQIVGHTRCSKLQTNKINKDTSITYIDYMEDGCLDEYIIEI